MSTGKKYPCYGSQLKLAKEDLLAFVRDMLVWKTIGIWSDGLGEFDEWTMLIQ